MVPFPRPGLSPRRVTVCNGPQGDAEVRLAADKGQLVGMHRAGRRRIRWVGAAAALALAVGVAGPVAASPADQQLASTNPQNNTPRVITEKSRVQAIVRVGDTVVVGGTFAQVQEAGTGTVFDRPGLFAFNADTGAVSTTFVPDLRKGDGTTGGVDALVVAPDGQSVYVGGDFRTINGSGPARLQRISLVDGQRLSSFKNPAPNNRVFDLKLSGERLYVAGSFTSLGGVARGGLASLDASTGALTDVVNLPFSGVNWGGVTTVRKIDVTPTGDRMIAIGNFTAVAGQSRVQVAMLNTAGATATVDPWRTASFGGLDCSSFFDTYLRDVDFAPDGSFFVVVTTGGYGTPPRLCDSASRWETYATGDQQPTWVDYTGGDTFWAVEVTGPVAYVGGHFRWMNNPYGNGVAGPGAVTRTGLGALDTRNGLPFSWDPTRTRGVGVFDFHVTQTELWAGSDTKYWAGEARDRLAAFPWQGGLPLPADKLGSVPGDVVQLDSDAGAGTDVQSRYLVNASSPVSTTLNGAGINWANTRGAFMADGTVWSGWTDGTFKKQSFDGNTFGAQTTVPLNGGSFGGDLSSSTQRVTSMFYDSRTGRMYYTRTNSTKGNGQQNNDGGLFYRSFTPESGVVGAVRWDTLRTASVSAIDAANIRGAFLSGGWLYYVTSTGALRRIQFGVNGFVGTSEAVNSAIDWRAKGLFLSSQPSIQAPNVAPTAAFDKSCVGLSCSFDGTTSSDSDGSIASYSWDFGDGSPTESGARPSHVFPSTGSYPVTLTVTDNDGATGSVTVNVSVAPIPSAISFRAASEYEGKQLRFHKWQLPGAIQAGDTVVMAVTGGLSTDPGVVLDTNRAPVAGWSEVADVTDTDTRTVLYAKTATAQDAGATVGVVYTDGTNEVSTRAVASVVVYDGVASVAPVATAVETSTKNAFDHTTPDVTVPDSGDWVLSYWSDKTSSTTSWTPPAGQTVRAEPVSYFDPAFPTTVRVTGLLTDDGAPTLAGARSGLTATALGKSMSATMATVVLQSE